MSATLVPENKKFLIKDGSSLQPVGVQDGRNVYKKPYIKYLDRWKKEVLALMVFNGEISAREMERRYGIPRSTIGDWVEAYKNPSKTIRDVGNQPALDPIAKEQLKLLVIEREQQHKSIKSANFEEEITLKKEETRLRLNWSLDVIQPGFSRSSKQRLMKDIHGKEQLAQQITEARLKACSCPRVSYIWLVILLAFSSNLRPENKWNADSSIFKISGESNAAQTVVVIREKHVPPPPFPTTTTSSSSSGIETTLYIKWMFLCSAAGGVSIPVLIIAVNDMNPEEFLPVKVYGLTHFPGNDGFGFVLSVIPEWGMKSYGNGGSQFAFLRLPIPENAITS
jgi:hypothetical protein